MRNLTPPTTRPSNGEPDDMALLRRYVDFGSQDAFAQLVSRHLPWVYGACRKALHDKHMAEDAAQAVFIILARRADSITPQTRLSGWLFNTARFVVKDAKKQETRYRRRETIARELATDRLVAPRKPPIDLHTQAGLDAALATLTERDRHALLMHFYEGLSLAEMAEVLGISKDGAKKRVARALGRLRSRLGRKNGAAVAIVALASLLRTQSASAATPIGLADTIVNAALLPGRCTGLAGMMAQSAMNAIAGAGHRLLRAALAAEVTVALVLVTAYTLPRGKPASDATGRQQASAVSRVAPLHPLLGPDTIVPFDPIRARATTSAGSAATAADDREPPYRSGADDPPPAEKPLPPYPQPKLLSAGGGGGGSSTAGGDGSTSGTIPGSTYAGLEPVHRTYPQFGPTAPAAVERPLVPQALIALATAPRAATQAPVEAPRTAAHAGAPSRTATAETSLPSDAGAHDLPPLADPMQPANVSQPGQPNPPCPRPTDQTLPPPLKGQHPIHTDGQLADGRGPRHLRDLFVEAGDDADADVYFPWGRKRSLGDGMHPYTVIGKGPERWLAHHPVDANGDDLCPILHHRGHAHTGVSTNGAIDLGPMTATQAPEPGSALLTVLAATLLGRRRRRGG